MKSVQAITARRLTLIRNYRHAQFYAGIEQRLAISNRL
jgi:hypothetical protein